ncbi:MAG: cbb3-type cytochrome c oxidase subunit I, partial [Aeromonadaceae bacterium]
MFGKLTLEAIPYHEPIIMGAVGAMILGGLALVAALTYFGKWKWLWTEWLTSVDHKRIGVMYIIVAMLMLLRGFADAIMMRMHMAAVSAGTEGFLPPHHYDQIFTAHGVIMIFFVAMPFIVGLMNFAVPLQIGACHVQRLSAQRQTHALARHAQQHGPAFIPVRIQPQHRRPVRRHQHRAVAG